MQALFVPLTTGAYIFGSAMDDIGKVYLSRDETEANKQEIINVPHATSTRYSFIIKLKLLK